VARTEAEQLIGHPISPSRLGGEFEQEIMEQYWTEYMVDGASLQATVEND